MSNIDKQAFRQLATKATPGPWEEENGEVWIMRNGTATSILTGVCGDDTSGQQDFDNARFIAAANPAAVLALLDELEAKDKSISFLKDQLAQLANF
ncbi:ead/Ea22-like family protein, partial [Enterobacter kobei]|uniref:ead/Ea22-like family protein n=1 Tax=Enterobacter kobei TaxID=208224 RepID=UPI001E5C6B2B